MNTAQAQSYITEILKESPITFVDLMGRDERVDSFEKIHFFATQGEKYYQWLPEFSQEYRNIGASLSRCIEAIIKDGYDISSQKYLVRNSVTNFIRLGSRDIDVIFPGSLENTGAINVLSIRSIYDNFGIDGLKKYIEIHRNRSSITNALNDEKYRGVAFVYILNSAGVKIPSTAKRDYSANSLNNLARKTIDESIAAITKEKEDYLNYVENTKNETSEYLRKLSEEYESFSAAKQKELEILEKTYEEKIQLSEPVAFMKDRSEEYKRSFRAWTIAAVILSSGLVLLLMWGTSQMVTDGSNMQKIAIFGKELPVYSNIAIIAAVTLVAYIIKNIIKIAMTAKHMEQEYRQKYILTNFFLTISKSDNIGRDTKDRIIMSLFEKADTGLIKYDTSDGSILTSITQSIKK